MTQENKFKGLPVLIVFGILIGAVSALFSYLFFIIASLFFLCLYVKFNYSREESLFLIKLVITSFFVLTLLSVLGKLFGPYSNEFNLPSSFPDKFEFADAEVMYRRAYNINMLLGHHYDKIIQIIPQEVLSVRYGLSAQLYWMSFLFYFFQLDTLLPCLTNILLFLASGVLLYSLARRIFFVKIARTCVVLFLFYPPLMFWSISSMKDTSIIFMILLFTHTVYIFSNGGTYSKICKLLLLFGLAIIMNFSRHYVGTLAFFSLFVPSVLIHLIHKKKARWLPLFLVVIFISALIIFFRPTLKLVKHFYKQAFEIHMGTVAGKRGIDYQLVDSRYYFRPLSEYPDAFNYMVMSVKSTFYFIFAPFPFDFRSKALFYSTPIILFWYVLFFFSFYGAAVSLKYRNTDSLVLIFSFIAFAFFYGMHSGNYGTVFRHRDMITPFCLIFSSAGLYYSFNLFEHGRYVTGGRK